MQFIITFKCNFHHSVIYHYCPSNIEECGCSNKNQDVLEDLENSLLKVDGHVSICADLKGYVYLVSNCRKNIGKAIDSDLDAMKNVSDFDPSCETFKQINKNVEDNLKLEKYGNTNKIMNRDKEITQIVSGAMVAVTEHDTVPLVPLNWDEFFVFMMMMMIMMMMMMMATIESMEAEILTRN